MTLSIPHTGPVLGGDVPRPRRGSSEFWVESPLQLLSAVEAHTAGLTGQDTLIRVRAGVPGLELTRAALRDAVPSGVRLVEQGRGITRASASKRDRWGVGDLHSGLVQRAMLGRMGRRELIIIDDGLATLTLLHQLASETPVPLVRSAAPGGPLRRALGLGLWRLTRARAAAGKVLVVTAMPLDEDLHRRLLRAGVKVEGHRFEWLRAQPVTESFPEPTVVIGSALAADGLIREEPYLDWVESLTEEGPLSYFPHRREGGPALERLARHPRITVRPNTIPVEMRLRGLLPGQRVQALPSTAIPSLRLLLGGRDVRVHGTRVPGSWWTAAASPELRDHLQSSVARPVSRVKPSPPDASPPGPQSPRSAS